MKQQYETYFGVWGETTKRRSFRLIPAAYEIRQVMYSTWKYRLGSTRRLRHHMTDIVVWCADGSITIDTGHGDEMSRTTCERLNFFLRGYGLRFHREKNRGFVTLPNGETMPLESPTTLEPEALKCE